MAAAPLFHQLALMPDGKAHVGAHQGMTAHGINAMRQLGRVGFQKFASRRGAEKQLLDLYRGARAARHGPEFTASTVQQPGAGLVSGPGEDRAVCDGVDGGQGFAAKSHGAHRLQLAQAADLAGGVAFEGDRQLIAQNAEAVVLHGNQAHATGQ